VCARLFVIDIAFAICLTVCQHADAISAGWGQSSAAVQVSTQFQGEIAKLGAEGLRLKEAVEASLDGKAKHLAAIFERARPNEPSEAFELRIIEYDGQKASTILRRSEFFFTFAAVEGMAALNATDINSDGLKEVIVQSSSGGNCWSCNPTEIYRVSNHRAELIAAGPIQKIIDLDGDGVKELIVADTRWEMYDDLSHAASPWAVMIYAWRNGRYVYASSDFPAYYKGELQKLRAAIEEAKADITSEDGSDDFYVGRAIALAISYAHMGEPEQGLKEMEAALRMNARSVAQSKRREGVISDFRSGESARKLRAMKYGDPIL
jgi:hypothetical protein